MDFPLVSWNKQKNKDKIEKKNVLVGKVVAVKELQRKHVGDQGTDKEVCARLILWG